jgi:hypothetical protein
MENTIEIKREVNKGMKQIIEQEWRWKEEEKTKHVFRNFTPTTLRPQNVITCHEAYPYSCCSHDINFEIFTNSSSDCVLLNAIIARILRMKNLEANLLYRIILAFARKAE